MTDFYVGGIVAPPDLLYRDRFISQLWHTLRIEHVLLIGPRRTGKSSVMNHLRERPQKGWLVVFLNVQDLEYPAQLVQELIQKFYEQEPDYLQQFASAGWELLRRLYQAATARMSEVEVSGVKVVLRESDQDWNANWKKHAEELLHRIRSSHRNVLIILDELPDMLLNMTKRDSDEALDFMAWFRKQRDVPPPHQDPIRWLVGGSVNLPGTMDNLGRSDLLNNLHTAELPILTPDEVRDFVSRMLRERSVDFEEAVPSRVEEALGRPIPVFLQMATQELWRSVQRAKSMRATVADVAAVFKELSTGMAAQQQMQHYYSRIRKYYAEPQASLAYGLLRQLCNSGPRGLPRRALKVTCDKELSESLDSAARDSLFNNLLQDLRNDFYIGEVTREERYDFQSGLMKVWWKKCYG